MMIAKVLEGLRVLQGSPERPLTANWKIFRGLVVIGVCSVLAKLAATAKEITVAARFGRGDDLEAFLIALLLPATVVGLIASSFSGAIIPTYIQVREKKGREAAQQLFSNVQVLSLLLLTLLCIGLAAAAPYYLPLLGSGFTGAKLELTRNLLYELLPYVVLSGTLSVWSCILNASERFALPALTPIVTPLAAIFALFFLGRSWGIFALVIGTVGGAILEAGILGSAVQAHGISLRLRWFGMSTELREVIRQYTPMVSGAALMSTSPIIDQSMAAMLTSGSVAALSYGNKIVSTITFLGSAALSTAVLSYFSQMVAERNWKGCRRTLKVYTSLVLSITVPVTIGLIASSRHLVQLLYQRGAFTEADVAVVSAVQILLSPLVPFYIWAVLFIRLLSSLHRNDLLLYGAVINAVLNILLNFVFMKEFGVAGIALSTSLVYLISAMYLGFWTLKLLSKEETADGLH
jgi:putative peptidoglycan lipid II flippase